jgi:lipopolysaccharide export system ATP-binding protein
MALLECSGMVKVYPNGKRAVDGVAFHVDEGEIVGLLGPNGAGKTTSFRMACGLVDPTQGRVTLQGVDVTRWPMFQRARHGMGFLPQNESVFSKLSVEQNLLAILEFMNITKAERYDETDRLLHQFGLQDKRKQVAGTLSGGERRRLEIARCLSSRPSLILLDEPFTGIDPVTIHSIQDIIYDLRDSGISILLTDHRERETLTITDRSYIICAGKVVVSGDAETVLSDPDAQAKYFGTRFDAESIIEGKAAFRQPRQAQIQEESVLEEFEGDASAYDDPNAADGYYGESDAHDGTHVDETRSSRRRSRRRKSRGHDDDQQAAA